MSIIDLACRTSKRHAHKQATGSGAINFYGLTSTITRCWFASNTAYSFDDASGSGGAVGMANGRISNCTFHANIAYGSGGALWVNGDVEIQNCRFDTNTALANGGAVYSTSPLSVEETLFSNCVALYGAALFSTAQTDISATIARGFGMSSALDAVLSHEPTDISSRLVIRESSFEQVELVFVTSSQPGTVVIYNCDGLNTTDVELSSLLTCGDSAIGDYCAAQYCTDATVGIEVMNCNLSCC